ncbi:MAG: glycosyltransferase family 4 protein [Asgard group archaeon]|nr:glycosyltransferase family 4 protein [Asgard group archaeon]
MKILMITDTYHPCFDGIVRYLDYLIPELISQGHTVTVVSPNYGVKGYYSYPYEGLEIIRTATPKFRVNAYAFGFPGFRLLKAIKKADFVIIHSLMPLGTLGGVFAKLMRKNIGFFCHHDERVILNDIVHAQPFLIRILFWMMRKYYAKLVDIFFCATERFRCKLHFFGVPDDKIIHTPFAINKTTFHPEPEIDLRKRYAIPPDGVICSYLGRLSVEKNVDNIIHAMDLAMNDNPNLFALIVGGGPDKEKFYQQSRVNNDRFIFTGYVPEEELQSHYSVSNLFVTPTLNESSCFTVFEAMTCRVPVITAEKDHDPDIIHKYNALLVKDVLDPNEIKENILLLANNQQVREAIALEGQALIANRTWANHAHRFLNGLEDVLITSEKNKYDKQSSKIISKIKEFRKSIS